MALGWAGAFGVLGLSSAPPTPDVPGRVDLLGHFLASALLALLIAEWLDVRRGRTGVRARRGGFLLALSVGLGIELLQTLSPVRSFEVADLVADLAGCAAGSWAHGMAVTRLRSRHRLTVLLDGLGLAAVVGVAASFLLV